MYKSNTGRTLNKGSVKNDEIGNFGQHVNVMNHINNRVIYSSIYLSSKLCRLIFTLIEIQTMALNIAFHRLVFAS